MVCDGIGIQIRFFSYIYAMDSNQGKREWASVISKGDTQKQAFLRNSMIKKKKTKRSIYVSTVLSVLKPAMKVLDIGCGTAHIIQELAMNRKSSLQVGLDVSKAMLKVAKENCERFHNIRLVAGDGLSLPFPDQAFDIIITRLAEYSPQEAYRVLKRGGNLFEYSLGPEADKEIKEFFPRRIERENFFFPRNLRKWKQEVCEHITEAGFIVSSIRDYKEEECHESEEELMDLIEMVPLVQNFDREKDREKIRELTEKYGSKKRVKTTWHYYILMARKS